tara:strand:+ start:619 stop:801 length:183 start_codon:yes stop_codon:yes gene_type:complete
MSYDLLSYKQARIDALQEKVSQLETENDKLMTYIFELIDEDCPNDYKKDIKNDVFSRNIS